MADAPTIRPTRLMRAAPLALTIARLVAAFLVAAFILGASEAIFVSRPLAASLNLAAALLFFAAALTDWLDGWLARRWNVQSALGAALDHIADKALVAAILIALAYAGLALDLVVAGALLILRDLTIAGLREAFADRGAALAVSSLGKAKAGLAMLGLGGLLIERWLVQAGLALDLAHTLHGFARAALWASVILALWSAGEYVRRAIKSSR